MTSKVVAPSAQAPRKYELWRPIIQPQRRLVFERIHNRIAEAWSHSMRGYLSGDKRFEFEAMGFEVFRDFNSDQAEDSQVVVFAIEQAQVSGFLMLTNAVARTLVDTRLGIKPSPKPAQPIKSRSGSEDDLYPHRDGRGARGDSLHARAPERDLHGSWPRANRRGPRLRAAGRYAHVRARRLPRGAALSHRRRCRWIARYRRAQQQCHQCRPRRPACRGGQTGQRPRAHRGAVAAQSRCGAGRVEDLDPRTQAACASAIRSCSPMAKMDGSRRARFACATARSNSPGGRTSIEIKRSARHR